MQEVTASRSVDWSDPNVAFELWIQSVYFIRHSGPLESVSFSVVYHQALQSISYHTYVRNIPA